MLIACDPESAAAPPRLDVDPIGLQDPVEPVVDDLVMGLGAMGAQWNWAPSATVKVWNCLRSRSSLKTSLPCSDGGMTRVSPA